MYDIFQISGQPSRKRENIKQIGIRISLNIIH